MDGDLTWSWIFGVCCGFVLGATVFGCNQNHYWQKQAIQHGAAVYDMKTGEFTWKENQ
jgi:hypothetical protein